MSSWYGFPFLANFDGESEVDHWGILTSAVLCSDSFRLETAYMRHDFATTIPPGLWNRSAYAFYTIISYYWCLRLNFHLLIQWVYISLHNTSRNITQSDQVYHILTDTKGICKAYETHTTIDNVCWMALFMQKPQRRVMDVRFSACVMKMFCSCLCLSEHYLSQRDKCTSAKPITFICHYGDVVLQPNMKGAIWKRMPLLLCAIKISNWILWCHLINVTATTYFVLSLLKKAFSRAQTCAPVTTCMLECSRIALTGVTHHYVLPTTQPFTEHR